MSASAVAVMELAGEEAGRLGQDYIGDEHVLLGLLRHGGPAAALLTEAGATLAGARSGLAGLQERGLTPGSHPGSAQALRALGIDAGEVRQRLTAVFGAEAVAAAVRGASRGPWWRGGRRVRTPLCGSALLAKRALHLAGLQAGPGRDIGPEQLLYGVLRDIADPAGTQLSRRWRWYLAQPVRRVGGAHPALLLLCEMGVDPDRLRHRLAGQTGAQG
ncbi:MAG: Clp protease N-terminal domain-containing protein [Actinomycetota bacterium]